MFFSGYEIGFFSHKTVTGQRMENSGSDGDSGGETGRFLTCDGQRRQNLWEESMKKTYKVSIIGVLLFVFLMTTGLPVMAENKHLIDDYGVFSSQTEVEEINTKLAEFSTAKQIDFLVIFSEPFSSPTQSEYTRYIENFYDDNNYGLGSDRIGTVMLVDMANRKISVRGFGDKMYPVFDSDTNIDNVTEKVGEKLRSEDYAGAVDAFVSEAYRLYRRQNRTFLERVGGVLFSLKGLGVALVGGLLVMLGFRANHNKNGKPQASMFEVGGSFRLAQRTDTFSHKNVTSRRIERSSGGSGGSRSSGSTSRSSGGTRGF